MADKERSNKEIDERVEKVVKNMLNTPPIKKKQGNEKKPA